MCSQVVLNSESEIKKFRDFELTNGE